MYADESKTCTWVHWDGTTWKPLDEFLNLPKKKKWQPVEKKTLKPKNKSHWPKLNIFSFLNTLAKLENQLHSQLYLDTLNPGDTFLEQNREEGVILLHAESHSGFRFLFWHLQTGLVEINRWQKKLIYCYLQTVSLPYLRLVLRLLSGGVSSRILRSLREFIELKLVNTWSQQWSCEQTISVPMVLRTQIYKLPCHLACSSWLCIVASSWYNTAGFRERGRSNSLSLPWPGTDRHLQSIPRVWSPGSSSRAEICHRRCCDQDTARSHWLVTRKEASNSLDTTPQTTTAVTLMMISRECGGDSVLLSWWGSAVTKLKIN